MSVAVEQDYRLRRNARWLILAAGLWSLFIYTLRTAYDKDQLTFLKRVGETFWNSWFWLPPHQNLTWQKTENLPWHDGSYYPRAIDSFFSISVALIMLSIRMLYNRYIGLPIGRKMKMRENKRRPTENSTLEELYAKGSKPRSKHIKLYMKETDMTESEIRQWLRKRRNFDKPTQIDKWCESSFKFIYYFIMFWGGLYVLWSKDWFHDNTPHHSMINVWQKLHPMEPDIFCYYQLELGFYWSLFFSQFMDVKRKDFWEMFVHHVITISLMITSMGSGWHRIGSIVVVTHDFSDWTLELPKNAHYMAMDWLAKLGIVLLLFGWVGSRLVYYPLYVISIVVWDQPKLYSPPYFGYMYLSSAWLIALFMLHILWFTYLVRTIVDILTIGETNDSRSESEAEYTDTEEIEDKMSTKLSKIPVVNGTIVHGLQAERDGKKFN